MRHRLEQVLPPLDLLVATKPWQALVSELFGLGPLPQDLGPPLQPLLTSHPLAVGADAPPLRVASPILALLLRRVCMSGPLVGRRWRLRRRFRRQPLALALALASSRCGGARSRRLH